METQTRTNGRRRYTPPRTDPLYRERRAHVIGQVLAQTAATQKAIALALGLSEAWVSRLVNGHPSVATYFERIEQLTRFSATDAGPLVAAGFAEMNRVMVEDLDNDDLELAIEIALLEETDREGIENPLEARRMLASEGEKDAIDDELCEALVASMASEAVALGLLWERLRRRAH